MAGLMSGFGVASNPGSGAFAPQRPPASPALFPAALPPQAPGSGSAPATLAYDPSQAVPVMSPPIEGMTTCPIDQSQRQRMPAAAPEQMQALQPSPAAVPIGAPALVLQPAPIAAPPMPTAITAPATTSPVTPSRSINTPLDDSRNAMAANLAANGHPSDRPGVQRLLSGGAPNMNRLAGALRQRRLGMPKAGY